MPDYNKVFHIYTDASNEGIGSCLGQYNNEKFQPIAFASSKYNNAQKNYSTHYNVKPSYTQIIVHGHSTVKTHHQSSADG